MNMPSPASTASPLTPEVLERLHAAGLRLTVATRAVLGVLAGSPQSSPCHFEVLAQLKARGVAINRVTLYRLLDRLAACGLLLRHPDPHERRWRFTWAGASPTRAPPASLTAAATAASPAPAAALAALSTRLAPAAQTALQPQFECDSCHQLLALPLALGQDEAAPNASSQARPQAQAGFGFEAQAQAQLHAQALAQNWAAALAALGHRAQRLDLTLHGTCAGCSHSTTQHPANPANPTT